MRIREPANTFKEKQGYLLNRIFMQVCTLFLTIRTNYIFERGKTFDFVFRLMEVFSVNPVELLCIENSSPFLYFSQIESGNKFLHGEDLLLCTRIPAKKS